MKNKSLSELTDDELLQEAKRIKSNAIINALLIGFLMGIIVYSIAQNNLGFFTLIPLFLIYKFVNNSDYDAKALKNLLEERGLK